MKRFSWCVMLGLFGSFSGLADELEEIHVTGSAIGADYYDMPTVTLKKKADFLVQRVLLINDSRSPDNRRAELLATITSMVKASKRVPGIELSYGEGFLTPITLDVDAVAIIDDRDKSDTALVNLFVKVKVDANRSTKAQIAELRNFLYKAKLDGRTELEHSGDIGLSIINPEQYRYDILAKIVAENKKMIGIVEGNCETTIDGLQGRVEWERSDIGELILYIPYATQFTCS